MTNSCADVQEQIEMDQKRWATLLFQQLSPASCCAVQVYEDNAPWIPKSRSSNGVTSGQPEILDPAQDNNLKWNKSNLKVRVNIQISDLKQLQSEGYL